MFLGRVGFEPQIRAVGSYLTANSATVTTNSATVTTQLILFHFMAYSMCLKRKIKSFVSVIIKETVDLWLWKQLLCHLLRGHFWHRLNFYYFI